MNTSYSASVIPILHAVFTIFCLSSSAVADGKQSIKFRLGELWECTARYPEKAPKERLQFLVTGITTQREVSRRSNFQNDGIIVSVALADLDPDACTAVKSFFHIGFTSDALVLCEPEFVGKNDTLIAKRRWREAVRAREKWLIGMQKGKGVIVDLPPSRILKMVKQRRCTN